MTRTRAEMIEAYGSLPMGMPETFTWTICRAHADVSWTTTDGGETWKQKNVIWAAQRQQRDNQALEAQRIQRELK